MKIVPEENLSVLKNEERPSSKPTSFCADLIVVSIAILGVLTVVVGMPVGYLYEKSRIASLPIFSIEAVTTSYINISSTTMPNTLSAQNLTIDLIIENPAKRRVEYNNSAVMVSYKGEIIWFNTLGLYHQEKGERTSIHVTFGNWPIRIRGIDNATITSGYGIFTVQVKGNYNSKTLDVSCGEVKINFSSFTRIQGDQTGSPIKCITETYISDKSSRQSTDGDPW